MTPGTAALVQDGRATTYDDLDRRSRRLALGLREQGIGRGDRVAFLGGNSVELVLAMFATARLGAVFLPLNARLAPPELAYVLDDSDTRLLLCERPFAAHVVDGPATVLFDRDAGGGLADLEGAGEEELDEPVGLDDLFMIQYTSGTSGRPKGVQLTHGNITWNVYNLLVDVDMSSAEAALVTAPLFHTAALNQLLLPTLLKGGTCLVEERFDAARALELIDAGEVTMLFGVTSMYLAIQNQPGFAAADLSGLRHALSGGAPIPESLLRTWGDRGVAIMQGYGLTESSPGATMLRPADAVRKLGSAGTPCFFTDLRVVRPDLSTADVDEPGEVLLSGPNVTPGYWRNDDATAAAFEGEWLHTGDLAVVDDEGYLRVVDRVKDMYISGGENVYPAEVEAAIHEHAAVAECAVVGVPDERWGEVGRAFVVVRRGEPLSETDLLAHLDGRLARYKMPRSVVFLDELPHNASGKMLKRELRS